MAYRHDGSDAANQKFAGASGSPSRRIPKGGSFHAGSSPANDADHHALQVMTLSKARAADDALERERIRKSVEEAIGPSNILERFGVDLITDMMMETTALQRIRPYILDLSRHDAITQLLIGRLSNAHGLVLAMQRGDSAARDQVTSALKQFDISEEMIEAQTYLMAIDLIDHLNRLSAQAQVRLDLQLRQIERRRPRAAAELQALSKDLQAEEAPQLYGSGDDDL